MGRPHYPGGQLTPFSPTLPTLSSLLTSSALSGQPPARRWKGRLYRSAQSALAAPLTAPPHPPPLSASQSQKPSAGQSQIDTARPPGQSQIAVASQMRRAHLRQLRLPARLFETHCDAFEINRDSYQQKWGETRGQADQWQPPASPHPAPLYPPRGTSLCPFLHAPGSTTVAPGTLTLRTATAAGPTSRGVWRTKKRLVWVDLFFSGVELYTTTITITIRRLFHLGCTAMYNWSNDLVMANKCFVGGNCFYQPWQWLPTNHSLWQKVRWIEFWWIRVTVQRGYLSLCSCSSDHHQHHHVYWFLRISLTPRLTGVSAERHWPGGGGV